MCAYILKCILFNMEKIVSTEKSIEIYIFFIYIVHISIVPQFENIKRRYLHKTEICV